MRILQAPINVAGQPSDISKAQRRLGYKSDVMIFKNDFSGRICDIDLKLDSEKSYLKRIAKILANFNYCVKNYDIFHFHYAKSLLPYNLDLPILKLLDKKILMQYWGSDVIQFDIAQKRMRYKKEDYEKVFHKQDDAKKRAQIAKMEKMVDVTVVGDPELLPFSPKSVVVAKALNLDEFEFIGVNKENHRLKIVHAPSNRGVKGTDKIIKIIEKLKNDGLDFEFILVENMTNSQAKEVYKSADLIIDDIMQGPYGILCMEAMALGKPVMCRIDDSLIHAYPGLPIINVNSDNLYQEIKKVLENLDLRIKLAKEGRKYMEANHDIMKTAQKFIDLYKSL